MALICQSAELAETLQLLLNVLLSFLSFCTFHLNLRNFFSFMSTLLLPTFLALFCLLECEVFTHLSEFALFLTILENQVAASAFSYFLRPAGIFSLKKEELCFLPYFLWPAQLSPAKTVMSLTLTRKRRMYVAGNFITRLISRAAKSLHSVGATHSDKILSSSLF